ncbi:MAG: L-threonine 3-dehydrogenase [Parachlamydiaceae bacterium]|nr:L-threonine 3-dehydrogenase [Parachlamydiaceae bacterium]
MKALVKKKPEVGIWLEEVPVPTIGENEVLIKTIKTSICGTDVHIYKWDKWAQKTIPVPLVIGHEFVGEIADIGKEVKNLKVGDRVCGEGHFVCNFCPNCMMGKKHLCFHTKGLGCRVPGCFADFFALPAENVFKIPHTIENDIAAIFDPYGNAVHTALIFPPTSENVLITGAGPIGIMAAAIALKAGAHQVVITDINDYRLELARKMGVMNAINIKNTSIEQKSKELNIEDGFTIGLEMSGHPNGLTTLLEHVRHGGKIALLGIFPEEFAVNWDQVIFKMLTLQGIYGREIFSTWYQMVNLIESGLDLKPLITHHFKAEEFQQAFDVMLSGNAGKVILDWS